MAKTVGILLFDDAEVLDFAGPFEVFSVTKEGGRQPFNVLTISEDGKKIRAVNGLNVLPDHSFEDVPHLDVLIIPGGVGARTVEVYNARLVNWVKEQYPEVGTLMSVCTGAFILAEAQLLNGKSATTHWASVAKMQKCYPEVNVLSNVKYVDEGDIMTSAGISAGIDLSFHYIAKTLGIETARQTAKNMEYDINS